MVFHISNRLVRYPNLLINGRPIERVTQFNFLGLILQSNMSWSMHTDHISLKVSKAIGIIYRLKDVYPLLVLQTLYNTLILPYFNYCILSWGATISNGNRLHLLQKKALRLISNLNYIAHTEPIHKNLRLLHLRNIGRIRTLLTFHATAQLIHALITTRLDFCNSILYNLPNNKIERLQRIQNQAARLLTRSPRRNHITPVLRELHWLRISDRK